MAGPTARQAYAIAACRTLSIAKQKLRTIKPDRSRIGTFLADWLLATGLSGVGLLVVPDRCLTGLLMPPFATIRRPKPSVIATSHFPIVEPAVPVVVQPRLFWEALEARLLLRVGDYEVGETFCPRLCGHPGIRY